MNPIEKIEWYHAAKLTANDYNPNFVMSPELRMLERNILRYGWMQPILANTGKIIIDGFHRVELALTSKRMHAAFGGMVPVSFLDIGNAEAMMLTIVMNRAKGTHAAVRMCDLVKRLIDDHGCEVEQLIDGMGMTRKEVELLYEDSIFITRGLDKAPFSKAWIPKESRHDPKPDID